MSDYDDKASVLGGIAAQPRIPTDFRISIADIKAEATELGLEGEAMNNWVVDQFSVRQADARAELTAYMEADLADGQARNEPQADLADRQARNEADLADRQALNEADLRTQEQDMSNNFELAKLDKLNVVSVSFQAPFLSASFSRMNKSDVSSSLNCGRIVVSIYSSSKCISALKNDMPLVAGVMKFIPIFL